jgi:hypothetical protein
MEKPQPNPESKKKSVFGHFREPLKPQEEGGLDEILAKAQGFQRQEDELTGKIDDKIREISSLFLGPQEDLPRPTVEAIEEVIEKSAKFKYKGPEETSRLDAELKRSLQKTEASLTTKESDSFARLEALVKDLISFNERDDFHPETAPIVGQLEDLTTIDFQAMGEEVKSSDSNEYIINRESVSADLSKLSPLSLGLNGLAGFKLSEIFNRVIKNDPSRYYFPSCDYLLACRSGSADVFREGTLILPGFFIRGQDGRWKVLGLKYNEQYRCLLFYFFDLNQILDEEESREIRLMVFEKEKRDD